MPDVGFIPALRFRRLTSYYDAVLAATLKEERFKKRLIAEAAIQPGFRVLDIGCGTGTLTILLKTTNPTSTVVGVDADADALAIARAKASTADVDIELHRALAAEAPLAAGSFDRVVSSLVLHHLDRSEKLRTLRRARELLKPGGELHVADWGKAQNVLMRVAFLSVQLLDGFRTTSDNVRGALVELMSQAGLEGVRETHHEMTVFGTLSLYRAARSSS